MGQRVSGSGSRTLVGVPPSGSPRPPRLSGLPAHLPFCACGWRAACREGAAAHRGSSVGAAGQAQEGTLQAGLPGRCAGRGAALGDPWQLEERLAALRGPPASASACSCPAALRPLLHMPDLGGETPCAPSSVDWGLPCRPLPSALPGSCWPALRAWGAGSGPQPFEWAPGDGHGSWWPSRTPDPSLWPWL